MKVSPMLKCREMKGNEGKRFANHYLVIGLIHREPEIVSTMCLILHSNVQLADN